MRFWLAYIDELNTPLDTSVHCTQDVSPIAGYSFNLILEEGAVGQLQIVRKHGGWNIVAPGAPKYVILIESPTGEPEDAYVIARGRIVGVPADIFQPTQTLEIACSEWDLFRVAALGQEDVFEDGRLIKYCREHLASAPHFLQTLSDMDRFDPASYLAARSEVFYFDPATHVISTSDIATGERIVNMGRSHAHSTDERPEVTIEEMPVPRARLKLVATWTQELQGLCNIAGAIRSSGTETVVRTMSPDFMITETSEMPGTLVDMAMGAGWSLDKSRVLMSPVYSSPLIRTGRKWRVEYTDPDQTGDGNDRIWLRDHDEYVVFNAWTYDFQEVWMKYELSQEREEVAYLSLDMNVQNLPITEVEDIGGEVSTIDLTIDPTTFPYEPGEWKAGDEVQFGIYQYRCKEDHLSTSFWQKPEGWQNVFFGPAPADYSHHPYWEKVPNTAPIERWSGEFFTTQAGKDTIAHGMLRLRKRLIERARCMKITLRYRWEDARDLTLKDSIRVEVPWPDGSSRAVVGKIVRLEKTLPMGSGPYIRVTIGVSLGTGEDGQTEAFTHPGYGHVPNYMTSRYLIEQDDEDPVMHGIGDIEYLIDADPVRKTVWPEQLAHWTHSVYDIRRENEMYDQLRAAQEFVQYGRDPRWAIQKNPTRIPIRMRNLTADGVLKRDLFVTGELLKSPRGIDIVEGAEP